MNRPVDILSYEVLERADTFAALPEAKLPLGSALEGPHHSGRPGFGFDIYGVGDFQPGDKRINIPATLKTGTLQSIQWEDEKSVPTLLVSDIVRDFYARTPGEQYSARALGMLASHAVMRMALNEQSPLYGMWTNGFEDRFVSTPGSQSSPSAAKAILKAGLQLAGQATDTYQRAAQQKPVKKGIFRKIVQPERPEETKPLAHALERSIVLSRKLLQPSRVVVVSDFRSSETDSKGREWPKLLKELGKENQVITIEITNPLLRGLFDDVDEYMGASQGVVLEDSQREEYKRAVDERNRTIGAALLKNAHVNLSIDTADNNWAKSFSNQLKQQ